ncbi:MAG TPA: hypothetical protein PL015_11375, partial [Opitutaceae bacterium]|nr:hypothetical protein [Opitutaceae bacterium]
MKKILQLFIAHWKKLLVVGFMTFAGYQLIAIRSELRSINQRVSSIESDVSSIESDVGDIQLNISS